MAGWVNIALFTTVDQRINVHQVIHGHPTLGILMRWATARFATVHHVDDVERIHEESTAQNTAFHKKNCAVI